jgi:hypothetical protein
VRPGRESHGDGLAEVGARPSVGFAFGAGPPAVHVRPGAAAGGWTSFSFPTMVAVEDSDEASPGGREGTGRPLARRRVSWLDIDTRLMDADIAQVCLVFLCVCVYVGVGFCAYVCARGFFLLIFLGVGFL